MGSLDAFWRKFSFYLDLIFQKDLIAEEISDEELTIPMCYVMSDDQVKLLMV